jgi:hypothetical protein
MTITRNSATPADPEAALAVIKLLVGDATYWKVDTGAYNSGSDVDFLIITPVGGNTPAQQIVFCIGPHTDMDLAPHTTQAATIFMGICPDGGADNDPHSAGGPCSGSGERFSKYLKISPIIPGGQNIDTLFALDSDESFIVWMRNDAAVDWYGGVGGAIIDPPTDADGEGTPGRIYGMAVTGDTEITNTFWSSATQFLSSGNGQGSSTQCFDPNATTTMIQVDRFQITMESNPRYLTQFGTQVSMPFALFEEDAPNNLIGIMRQIRQTTDGTMREVIQDSTGADKSFYIAAHDSTDFDVASFDNG